MYIYIRIYIHINIYISHASLVTMLEYHDAISSIKELRSAAITIITVIIIVI